MTPSRKYVGSYLNIATITICIGQTRLAQYIEHKDLQGNEHNHHTYDQSKLRHQDLNEITLIIKLITYNNNNLYIILINNIKPNCQVKCHIKINKLTYNILINNI